MKSTTRNVQAGPLGSNARLDEQLEYGGRFERRGRHQVRLELRASKVDELNVDPHRSRGVG